MKPLQPLVTLGQAGSGGRRSCRRGSGEQIEDQLAVETSFSSLIQRIFISTPAVRGLSSPRIESNQIEKVSRLEGGAAHQNGRPGTNVWLNGCTLQSQIRILYEAWVKSLRNGIDVQRVAP